MGGAENESGEGSGAERARWRSDPSPTFRWRLHALKCKFPARVPTPRATHKLKSSFLSMQMQAR